MNRLINETYKVLLGASFGVLGLFLFSPPALARDCTSSFQARDISSAYAETIMNDGLGGFGFGRYVSAEVLDCEYYPSQSAFIMLLQISWLGLNNEEYWGVGE